MRGKGGDCNSIQISRNIILAEYLNFRPDNLVETNEINVADGDQVYYQQMARPLLHDLHRSMRFGELGSVDSGYFFLCRHEDRIMWIQVYENIYVAVFSITEDLVILILAKKLHDCEQKNH